MTAERLGQLLDQYKTGTKPVADQALVGLLHEGTKVDVANFAAQLALEGGDLPSFSERVEKVDQNFTCPKCEVRTTCPPAYPGDFFDCQTCGRSWQ